MKKIKTILNYLWRFIKWVSRGLWYLLRNKNTYKILLIVLSYVVVAYFFSNYTLNSPIKSVRFQPIIQKRYLTPVKTEKPRVTSIILAVSPPLKLTQQQWKQVSLPKVQVSSTPSYVTPRPVVSTAPKTTTGLSLASGTPNALQQSGVYVSLPSSSNTYPSNTTTPTPTPTPKISTYHDIYEQTRQFESNNGNHPDLTATHNYCKSMGKVNEIGYFPEGNRKFCFKDEAEQEYTFNLWVEKRIKEGYTLAEAICYYVTGYRQPMCKRSIAMGI